MEDMVNEGRTRRLKQLLKRLGKAVHSSVADSDELHACLAELRSEGWDLVMLLEASLVCREGEGSGSPADSLRVHIEATHDGADFRLGPGDARWLESLGISPTRYRSPARHPIPPPEQMSSECGDG